MSYLSMLEAKLPPGFRFHPRDDELICDYLAPKIISAGGGSSGTGSPSMIDIDLNKCEPWDLPEIACVGSKEWYFFSLRDRKYATGQRTNRATVSGYWKATGKDRQVTRKGTPVGMRKTLVFYQGRAPKGKKTGWVMHEYRSEGRSGPPPGLISCKEDWVLCRVFYQSRGTGMASKPTTATATESRCDDAGSSSHPPLSDAYNMTFDPRNSFQPEAPANIMCNIGFGATTAATTSLEQVPCFSNYTRVPEQTKDLASSCFMHAYDHLSMEGKHQQAASSESYLTETALSSSTWYPFQS